MRSLWCLVLCLCLAACSQPAPRSPAPTDPPTQSGMINPARIAAVRAELPPGYELADVDAPTVPVESWGLNQGWTAEPPRCAALGDPGDGGVTTRGWSASGPGGIVYAVVTGGAPLDRSLLAECGRWTVTSGSTSGNVTLIDAPAIDATETVGMATETTTVVEGGTETRSLADTFTAYLTSRVVGSHVVFVTVVTDPGSPNPPLGQHFVADLLVKSVSALRG